MVPHDKILTAIALAANAGNYKEEVIEFLCRQHFVKFPAEWYAEKAFWNVEVVKKLPEVLYVQYSTSQMALEHDYTPLLNCAKHLGVDKYISIGNSEFGENTPVVTVPAEILYWRQHESIRMALEVLFLCGVSIEVIASDMRKMYGRTFEEDYLAEFRDLYCDKTKLGDWMAYSKCLSAEELSFKFRLSKEHVDFVRWKLGIPVHLDNETVLDRLMSDAYFTERLIKYECRGADPHGLPALSNSDIARIKMERDTLFKCVDRKVKLREAAGQSTGVAAAIQKHIDDVMLEYQEHENPLSYELEQ
jgi:hypothetical protein